jgi:glycosyltransferase involved in cell wall biosynthesis
MAVAHHILAPVQSFRGGGVEKVLLRLAAEWVRAGRRVTLVVGDPSGPLAADVAEGVEQKALGNAHYVALARLLPKIVRRLQPDVVFIPGNHYTGVGAWTRIRLGPASPLIVAKISNALIRSDQSALLARGYRAWLRAHPRFLDRLVAMTPAMREEAALATGMPRERIAVIANPTPRAARGVPLDRSLLLGVGRLVPQKRWDRAIRALAAVRDLPVQLTILGEGPLRSELTALAASLDLADRVQLPGYSADPSRLIAAAAVVLLTSDYEGVPGVLREAVAAGTPVVTTESSVAVREIIDAPELGSVVRREDEAMLAATLRHWLAPGVVRPMPRVGPDTSATDYLSLFDSLSSS